MAANSSREPDADMQDTDMPYVSKFPEMYGHVCAHHVINDPLPPQKADLAENPLGFAAIPLLFAKLMVEIVTVNLFMLYGRNPWLRAT